MPWPTWIESLRRSYLNDEASVFLLHGAIDDRWDIDGKAMTATEALAQMLASSRAILAIYDPEGGLRFHGPTDQNNFTRLTETRQALEGRRDRNRARTPEQALGLIWMALTTAGPAQGYLISGVERLIPARKKHIEPLSESAPPIWDWARDSGLRGSNNVVVFLARRLEDLRGELAAGCAVIEVPKAPPLAPPKAPPQAAEARAAAEVEATLAPPSPPPPPVSRADAEAEVEALGTPTPPTDLSAAAAPPSAEVLVNAALRAAILRHPSGAWPGNLPAREALAAVIFDLAPQRCGPLTFTVSDDQVIASGPGADWFTRWYASDVAVDAASGMALSALVVPDGGFTEANLPELTPAAVRAMARRLDKALAAE